MKEKIESINIDVSSSKPTIDCSHLVDSVKHIKLATNDTCLLRQIKKIVVTENELLVFDDFVYVFDHNGDFIRKIGKEGKGPGELLNAFDFVYDRKTQNIEIFDFSQNKLNIYTKEGVFKSEQQFPFGRINRFEKREDGTYITWAGLSNKSSKRNEYVGHKIQIGNFKNGFTKHKPCYQYDDNITLNQSFTKSRNTFFFLETLNDTIFEITPQNTFSGKYYINFGKNQMPKEIRNLPTFERMYSLQNNFTIATVVDNFYFAPKFKYFNYLHNKNKHNVFIIDNKITIGRNIKFKDILYSNFSYYNGENIFVSVEYPDKVSESFKKTIDTRFDISDNPIIAIFYLK